MSWNSCSHVLKYHKNCAELQADWATNTMLTDILQRLIATTNNTTKSVWVKCKHYIGPTDRVPSVSFQKKIAHLVGWLGSGPRLIGQEYGLVPIFKKKCPPRGSVRVRTPPHRSRVWVSANFQKNAHLVGRLGSRPRLVADVVFTHTHTKCFKKHKVVKSTARND